MCAPERQSVGPCFGPRVKLSVLGRRGGLGGSCRRCPSEECLLLFLALRPCTEDVSPVYTMYLTVIDELLAVGYNKLQPSTKADLWGLYLWHCDHSRAPGNVVVRVHSAERCRQVRYFGCAIPDDMRKYALPRQPDGRYALNCMYLHARNCREIPSTQGLGS